MARIAIGGFQHETNTFAQTRATFAEFEKHDGWPGLTRGEALFDAVAGINLPIAGFIEAARPEDHALVPLLWCSAEPSAHVTNDAFERITAMLCEDLAASVTIAEASVHSTDGYGTNRLDPNRRGYRLLPCQPGLSAMGVQRGLMI